MRFIRMLHICSIKSGQMAATLVANVEQCIITDKSLTCTPGTNVTLCVNHTSIKRKKKKQTWCSHLKLILPAALFVTLKLFSNLQ